MEPALARTGSRVLSSGRRELRQMDPPFSSAMSRIVSRAACSLAIRPRSSLSLACIASSLSMTTLSSACLAFSPSIAVAYSPSAIASASFLGPTTLATRS